jgi:hypothetical protein
MSKIDTRDYIDYETPEGARVLTVYLQTHSAESETVYRNRLAAISRR